MVSSPLKLSRAIRLQSHPPPPLSLATAHASSMTTVSSFGGCHVHRVTQHATFEIHRHGRTCPACSFVRRAPRAWMTAGHRRVVSSVGLSQGRTLHMSCRVRRASVCFTRIGTHFLDPVGLSTRVPNATRNRRARFPSGAPCALPAPPGSRCSAWPQHWVWPAAFIQLSRWSQSGIS